MFQSTSASLGSLALYRSTLQAVVFTFGNLLTTARMAFQGVFLMGAFCAAMSIHPELEPILEDVITYPCLPSGMNIEARSAPILHRVVQFPSPSQAPLIHLPGLKTSLAQGRLLHYPARRIPRHRRLQRIRHVPHHIHPLLLFLTLHTGKSTLAKVLLRILDFDHGELLINGVDIRRLSPSDYHRRVSAVFQDFSKFNASVRDNVGLGYVQKLHSLPAVSRAIHLGGAESFVDALPNGLKTRLDSSGSDTLPPGTSSRQHHGLSGGQVRAHLLTSSQ